MSIIYDALKKVEASIHKDSAVKIDKKERKPIFKICLLYGLAVCSGFFIANILFVLFTKSLQNKTNLVTKSQPQAQVNIKQEVTPVPEIPKDVPVPETNLPAPVDTERKTQPLLVLNGVFFSEDEGYALINNRIVKKGDIIDGATVKQVTLEGVRLEFEGSVIRLSASGK